MSSSIFKLVLMLRVRYGAKMVENATYTCYMFVYCSKSRRSNCLFLCIPTGYSIYIKNKS